MRLAERKVTAVLKQHGYKLTPQRRAVINTIASSQDHLTPADIYERVQKEYPSIGLVTVYRTLEILIELGFICKVHAQGDCRSYLMRRPSGHHHHLVCSDCGVVVDFTDCDLGEMQKRLTGESGFRIDSHLLEFTGLCQACQIAT